MSSNYKELITSTYTSVTVRLALLLATGYAKQIGEVEGAPTSAISTRLTGNFLMNPGLACAVPFWLQSCMCNFRETYFPLKSINLSFHKGKQLECGEERKHKSLCGPYFQSMYLFCSVFHYWLRNYRNGFKTPKSMKHLFSLFFNLIKVLITVCIFFANKMTLQSVFAGRFHR